MKSPRLRAIFGCQKSLLGNSEVIVDEKEELNVKNYYFIFLFLSAQISKRDFNRLMYYNQDFDFQDDKEVQKHKLLQSKEFFDCLTKSIFETGEDLVYEFMVNNVPNLQIFISAKIIQNYIDFFKINELKQIFVKIKHSKSAQLNKNLID